MNSKEDIMVMVKTPTKFVPQWGGMLISCVRGQKENSDLALEQRGG
jgi:hypothetical protein